MYRKPELKSYLTEKMKELVGPCLGQYDTTTTTTTLYTQNGGEADGNGDVEKFNGSEYDYSIDDTICVDYQNYEEGEHRGLVGFNIATINSTVVSATLYMYQTSTLGNPYEHFGEIRVAHVDFGSSIEAGEEDFSGAPISEGYAVLSPADDTISWKTANVTQFVQSDINNSRTHSQFRLYFATTVGGTEQEVCFEDSNGSGGTEFSPELVIEYN